MIGRGGRARRRYGACLENIERLERELGVGEHESGAHKRAVELALFYPGARWPVDDAATAQFVQIVRGSYR